MSDIAGPSEGDEAALGRLLESRPHSVEAHIAMADLHARAGREDLATYFYRAALELAERQDLQAEASSELVRVFLRAVAKKGQLPWTPKEDSQEDEALGPLARRREMVEYFSEH